MTSRSSRRIYVASSWRNQHQQRVVSLLRELGHDVYDFKNPAPGNTGFSWKQISIVPEAESLGIRWSGEDLRAVLADPIAVDGFGLDMRAMERADCCVLVLPCGRSAHLELGWFAGKGRPSFVYVTEPTEPELMYKMIGPLGDDGERHIVTSDAELSRHFGPFAGKRWKSEDAYLRAWKRWTRDRPPAGDQAAYERWRSFEPPPWGPSPSASPGDVDGS